jgi:hypothetical protein
MRSAILTALHYAFIAGTLPKQFSFGLLPFSRYDFAIEIAKVFGLDWSLVTPVKMEDVKVWVAKRPRDSSLSLDKVWHELKPPEPTSVTLRLSRNVSPIETIFDRPAMRLAM